MSDKTTTRITGSIPTPGDSARTNGHRTLAAHLHEQVLRLAELTAEARRERKDASEAGDRARRLEDQARSICQRYWLHVALDAGAITVTLADGRLVTIEKQGSAKPPHPPRITVSQFAQPEPDSGEGHNPEVGS